jgi:hypothetical protein
MRYEIKGRVIDSFTGDGIAGVRVEAWDSDFLFPDDFLNRATTRSDRSFTIVFDESAFRDLFFDKLPDIYFKVFCYNQCPEGRALAALHHCEGGRQRHRAGLRERHAGLRGCAERR